MAIPQAAMQFGVDDTPAHQSFMVFQNYNQTPVVDLHAVTYSPVPTQENNLNYYGVIHIGKYVNYSPQENAFGDKSFVTQQNVEDHETLSFKATDITLTVDDHGIYIPQSVITPFSVDTPHSASSRATVNPSESVDHTTSAEAYSGNQTSFFQANNAITTGGNLFGAYSSGNAASSSQASEQAPTTTQGETPTTNTESLLADFTKFITINTQSITANEGTDTIPVFISTNDTNSLVNFTISGVPSFVSLSAGNNLGNGVWSLSSSELQNLSLIISDDNYSGNFTLTISVSANNTSGSIQSSTVPLQVTINPVADAPDLTLQNVSGMEDHAIALNIQVALTDLDGSETLGVITISNVPDDASLSSGINLGEGVWTVNANELSGLTITPPTNYSGEIHLTVDASSIESDGSSATTSGELTINVTPVASAPNLTANNVSGSEDSAINLDVSATLTDSGETLSSIIISGIPDGASLSAGTENPDGSWTLSPADLANLSFNPPENFSGSVNLNVSATSTESDGSTATSTTNFTVAVTPVADTPSLTANNVSGSEDTPINLDISAALTDASETLSSITISGLFEGASLSAGTENPDGSWTLSPADLANLSFNPPENFSGSVNLNVSATSTESDGSTATSTTNFTVAVTPVADTPSLTANNVSGSEDSSISLDVSAVLSDPSETLSSIIITGIPDGGSLSAGIENRDGSWTLSSSDLNNLSFTPPENFSGSVNLNIAATSTESDGSTATSNASFTVEVTPVADAPNITVNNVSGSEDSSINLDISAALTDASETLSSITISGLFEGASLSAGTDNHDGSWTLSPADLANLSFNPPENFSGSVNLNVSATSAESDGSTATSTTNFTVAVTPVADAPSLTANNVSGSEDTPINLDISTALVDVSETLSSITISGLFEGASLSAGTENPDGSWTLSPADLANLSFNPPENFSGSVNLNVSATSTESDGSTATSNASFTVEITPVADAPNLTVNNVSGSENTSINLDVSAALTDPSETLSSIIITGMYEGASLSAGTDNHDGSWTLSPADLTNLSFNPPGNFTGSINLNITAISTESDGSTATSNANFSVEVTAAADAPSLTANNVSGSEDSSINLDISAALTDPNETLSSITISGLFEGASLSAGTDNHDGSWTLSPADLANLSFNPPENFSGSIDLNVAVTSSESNGSTATSTASFSVGVTPVADAPSLTANNVSGSEDTPINLDISAALTDASETLSSITISGLFEGASLSAGTDNHDGSWTLSPADLANLSFNPPENFSGSIDLNVTAVSTESDASTATSNASFTVEVTPVADAPNLTANNVLGNEDTPINLDISAALTDASETLSSITISGLFEGVTLSAGTDNHDGSWTVSANDLSNLSLTPPENFSGSMRLNVTATSTESDGSTATSIASFSVAVDAVADAPSLTANNVSGSEDSSINLDISAALTDAGETLSSITISGIPSGASLSAGTDNLDGSWTVSANDLSNLSFNPPDNFSGSIDLSVSATSTEIDGSTATSNASFSVAVTPVADAPSLTVNNVSGSEDTPINLDISAVLTDASETLSSITISGLVEGASLSAGTENPDGSWTLNPADLTNLSFNPPENFSGSIDLNVSAVSTESDGSTAISNASFTVGVTPVADAPSLTANNVSGSEDSSINLDVSAILTDASETLSSITISGIPDGGSLSAGTDNQDGSWTLNPADLTNLSFDPPDNFSGSLNLNLSATSTESDGSTSTSNASFTVDVTPVADAPSLTVNDASANNGATSISLDISSSLSDIDGSENLSVMISGVPDYADLSAGVDNGGGLWTLTSNDLNGLSITSSNGFGENFDLNITATSTENENGDTASISNTLSVNIQDIYDNNDILGTSGNDNINGTNQADNAIYGLGGDDYIDAQNSNDVVYGGAGNDYILGGKGDDILYGGEGNDNIDGGDNNDTIYGGSGNDYISDGKGNDIAYGGSGDDTFNVGAGNDALYGGAGNDLFVFAGKGLGTNTVSGGQGGSWTDAIQLDQATQDPNQGSGKGSWTLQTDADYTIGNDNSLTFDGEGSGTIVMNDGTQIQFEYIEKIIW